MIHFTLEEFLYSEIAKKRRLKNEPSVEAVENIEELVKNICDPVRALIGKPITIKSGYRSKFLNSIVGGAENSQHCLGEACDMTCSDNKYLFYLIKNNFDFDQLIGEDILPNGNFKWIHCSYTKRRKNRREVLIMKKVNGQTVYEKFK